MRNVDYLYRDYEGRLKRKISSLRWQKIHLDPVLLLSLLTLIGFGLFTLYSASDQSLLSIKRQLLRLLLGFGFLFFLAQIPPDTYKKWTPWIFGTGLLLLVMVLIDGKADHGARRWLNLGFFYFQPSELMKIATPMCLAWYLDDKHLPPSFKVVACSGALLIAPVLLTAKQPDLGTGIIIALSGLFVLLLSGIPWKAIILSVMALLLTTPIAWHFMHNYQKERVFTFLNPERDPLGSGYHIIQSKIAIGSGGFWGKGWLQGTQSHLKFLPEHTTDFIFSVHAEELGFIGSLVLIVLFLIVLGRCLYISTQAQTTFSRLLAGSLSLTFFISIFINLGMVVGILPVVGIPLPLVSYGGTSMVSIMAAFGMIMSIHTHKKLLPS